MIQLYIIKQWNQVFGKLYKIENKYYKIYEEGSNRVIKSLDIVKLTKDIRYLKLLAMIKM